eukprot:SAG25_NODE_12182_length_286_cov_0.545455_2_plen_56_part_01
MLRSGPLNDDVEQVLGPQSRAVMIVVYSATHGCVKKVGRSQSNHDSGRHTTDDAEV